MPDDRTSATSSRRPLRLWVLSDLSLDRFEGWSAGRIPPADVAVVAGGITQGLVEAVGWLEQHMRPHMPVIFVPGPLEYRGKILSDELERGRRAAAFADVRLLDGDRTDIEGVRFVGATLWTDFRLHGEERREGSLQAANLHHDHLRWIRLAPEERFHMRPWEAADLHARSLATLRRLLARPHDGPSVVVTHHAPHTLSVAPDAFVGPGRALGELLPASYASDLSALVERASPDLWVHGAVPEPVDYRLGRTRVLANPRWSGIRHVVGDFDPKLVVEV
jgi:hypothetical protein